MLPRSFWVSGLKLCTGHGGANARHHGERRRPGDLLDRVPGRHMADLVADHPGQLVLGVHEDEQPTRHVDVAAGKSKRVGFSAVDHLEPILDVAPGRLSGEPLPHALHVGDEGGIGEQPHLLLDPACFVTAQLLLALGRHQHQLRPPRDRIGGATAGGDRHHTESGPEGDDPIWTISTPHGIQPSSHRKHKDWKSGTPTPPRSSPQSFERFWSAAGACATRAAVSRHRRAKGRYRPMRASREHNLFFLDGSADRHSTI